MFAITIDHINYEEASKYSRQKQMYSKYNVSCKLFSGGMTTRGEAAKLAFSVHI